MLQVRQLSVGSLPEPNDRYRHRRAPPRTLTPTTISGRCLLMKPRAFTTPDQKMERKTIRRSSPLKRPRVRNKIPSLFNPNRPKFPQFFAKCCNNVSSCQEGNRHFYIFENLNSEKTAVHNGKSAIPRFPPDVTCIPKPRHFPAHHSPPPPRSGNPLCHFRFRCCPRCQCRDRSA